MAPKAFLAGLGDGLIFLWAFSFTQLESSTLNFTTLLSDLQNICRAMLWDIRKSSNAEEVGLVIEMDGHIGPVTHLYMDQYKIVSGGPEDSYVNVWEADTGTQTTSLICSELDDSRTISGCFAMAVDGCRVVTCSDDEQMGLVRFRDFDKATNHISLDCNKIASKFWGQGSYGYTDESDD